MFRQACRVEIDGSSVVFSYKNCIGRRRRYKHEQVVFTKSSLLESMLYNSDVPKDSDEDNPVPYPFVAVRVKPENDTGLREYCHVYKPLDKAIITRYIVFEFLTGDECAKFCLVLEESFGKKAKYVEMTGAEEYISALLKDNTAPQPGRKRTSSSSIERADFLKGRKDDDLLLCFPFPASRQDVESAACGLDFLGRVGRTSKVVIDGADTVPGPGDNDAAGERGRGHYVEIRVCDYERLEDGEFLNDSLIDFFVRWYVLCDTHVTRIRITQSFFFALQDDSQ